MGKINKEALGGAKTGEQPITDQNKCNGHQSAKKAIIPIKCDVDEGDQKTDRQHGNVQKAYKRWMQIQD